MRVKTRGNGAFGCCVGSHGLRRRVSHPTPPRSPGRGCSPLANPPTSSFCLLLKPTVAKLKGSEEEKQPDFVCASIHVCSHMCTQAREQPWMLFLRKQTPAWSLPRGSGSACPHFFSAGCTHPHPQIFHMGFSGSKVVQGKHSPSGGASSARHPVFL